MFTHIHANRFIGNHRRAHAVRCNTSDGITPELIERKRTSLKTRFYSVQRTMTFNEMNMILQPLFKNVNLEISVIGNKVHVLVKNVLDQKRVDQDTSIAVLDLVNDWNVHDEFRRFLIKSLTSANKNDIFRYTSDMTWKCPLSIEYVFDKSQDEDDDVHHA